MFSFTIKEVNGKISEINLGRKSTSGCVEKVAASLPVHRIKQSAALDSVSKSNLKSVTGAGRKKTLYGTISEETPLEKKCRKEISEYLSGKRKKFSIPISIHGTDFQQRVWKEMMKIPYGQTISYSELASKIGRPNSCRAVANACGANNIPVMIPCHRVVAKNGLGGFSAGINIKKELLKVEKNKI